MEENSPCVQEVATMEQVWRWCWRRYGARRAVGSRAVTGEMEEKQQDGRVFTRYQLWLHLDQL